MTLPTFSICIPNYNYARFLGDTIQSVLDQTYPHFEIIVADNASTDDSIKVVESFRDKRISLIRNHYNIGFAPNLQQVARQARNDFIILLSSDDRMASGALDAYMRILESQGTNAQRTIVFSESIQIDGNGIKLPENYIRPPFYRNLPELEHRLSNGKTYFTYKGFDVLRESLRRLGAAGLFCTMCYPKVIFDAVEGYNNVHLVDPDAHFTHKVLEQGPLVAWILDPLFEYRIHSSNQLGQQKKQASIKVLIDKYLYTLEVPESQLRISGLSRKDLVQSFINRHCIDGSLRELALGNYLRAFSGLAYSFATYPCQTLLSIRAYGLMGLLLLGPMAVITSRLIRVFYRRFGSKVMC
jgi:glycosyltransferase involved in cell wall biosynthesis